MAATTKTDLKGEIAVQKAPAGGAFSKNSTRKKLGPDRVGEIGFDEQRGLNRALREQAYRNSYPGEFKRLIKAGANVNSANQYGWTALMGAAKGGQEKNAKLLIDAGADVNAKDIYGVTVLMVAAKAGELAVVKLLIEKGADVNAMDEHGRTLLEHVEKYQRDELSRVIKEQVAKK